ncbi:MAG: hypothetical protein ACRELV_12290, partial [Longimicrobiales bacterium]
MTHRPYVALLCVLTLTGCWAWPGRDAGAEEEQTAGPPAAAVAALTDTMSLAQQLALLESIAVDGLQDVDELWTSVLQAEALTDRLLEAPLPFEWTASGYSVGTRLRQLQSQADLVVARLRRGDAVEDVRADVARFREQVQSLRGQLTEPGGPAPPPLDSLLAGTLDPRSPGQRVLGTPAEAPAEPTEPGGPR